MEQTSKSIAKKFTQPVLLTVLAVLFVVFCVSCWVCYQSIKSAGHSRYIGIMNVASEKISRTISGMEMNAMNEPYVHHVDSGAFEVRQVGSARHDYHKSDWYVRAKKSRESFWSDPYYYFDGTSISGHYTTFVKPIYDKSGRLACVCGADMTFEWLAKELQRIDDEIRDDELLNRFSFFAGADFYSVVINGDGSCIANTEGNTVKLTKEQVDRSLEQRSSGTIELNINGAPSTVYYTPIDHVNCVVAVVVPDQGVIKPLLKYTIILLLVSILGVIVVWMVCRRV